MPEIYGTIHMCTDGERVSCVIRCTNGHEKTFIANAILTLYKQLPLKARSQLVEEMISIEYNELKEM